MAIVTVAVITKLQRERSLRANKLALLSSRVRQNTKRQSGAPSNANQSKVGNEAEARVRFQELQHAYAVLSDPHERRWYDDHRDEILNPERYADGGDSGDEGGRGRTVNLTKFFRCLNGEHQGTCRRLGQHCMLSTIYYIVCRIARDGFMLGFKHDFMCRSSLSY